MDVLTITEKNKLIEYKNPIENLFKSCFGVDLDSGIWDWAYIKNPNGNPVVSLCFDNGNYLHRENLIFL